MARKQALLIVIVVVLLGAAGVRLALWLRTERTTQGDFPNGTHWICTNPACKHEFTLSMHEIEELERQSPGAPIACPKCGQTQVVRGLPCPACGKFYSQADTRQANPVCPHCGKPLPRRTGGAPGVDNTNASGGGGG